MNDTTESTQTPPTLVEARATKDLRFCECYCDNYECDDYCDGLIPGIGAHICDGERGRCMCSWDPEAYCQKYYPDGYCTGAKKLGLFHLNQERTDRQMDDIVQDCRTRIADRGTSLECVGVTCDMEFNL